MATLYTDAALKAKVDADPVLSAHAAALRDGEIARILNDRTRGFNLVRPIAWSDVVIWFATNGIRSAIQASADTLADPKRDAALAILDMVRNPNVPNLDVTRTAVVNLVATFLTATQKDALIARGTTPASEAEVSWGDGFIVGATHVSRALRGQA